MKKLFEKFRVLKTWQKVFIVVLLLLIVGKIVGVDNKKNGNPSLQSIPYDEGILKIKMERMAKGLITEKLKAPSTSKFGDIEYTHKGNDIMMRGFVDAQNSFGVMLRSKWYVVINFTGTTKADLDSSQKMKLIINELIDQ